jgi:hypothetical protein
MKSMLSDEELAIQYVSISTFRHVFVRPAHKPSETSHQYAQTKLLPRVIEAYRNVRSISSTER